MRRADAELLDRLSTGPSFLLLGQDWSAIAGGQPEPVSDALGNVVEGGSARAYDRIIGLAPERWDRAIEAIAGSRNEVPDWLRDVADFPWNGAFTTAIDGVLLRALDAEWRRVVPVVGRDIRRQTRRSPTELRVLLLFGAAGLPQDSRPPANRLELAARRGEARALLGDLADGLLTPRGVLVIDGYSANDWLSPEDLYTLIAQLLPGQVHLFSTSGELAGDEFIAAAVESGHLIAHPESLAAFMSAASETGRLVRPALHQDIDARFVRIKGRPLPVPRDVWNRVVASARPIDVSLLACTCRTPVVCCARFGRRLRREAGQIAGCRPLWRMPGRRSSAPPGWRLPDKTVVRMTQTQDVSARRIARGSS